MDLSKKEKNMQKRRFKLKKRQPWLILSITRFSLITNKNIGIQFMRKIFFPIDWYQLGKLGKFQHARHPAFIQLLFSYHYINILNHFVYLIVNPYYELLN